MIFETLHEAAQKSELILVDGGFCHYHKRKDGQLTIREIIVLPEKQGRGIGSTMLTQLRQVSGITNIFAKCPIDLPANAWYKAKHFILEDVEETPSGRKLNLWRLQL